MVCGKRWSKRMGVLLVAGVVAGCGPVALAPGPPPAPDPAAVGLAALRQRADRGDAEALFLLGAAYDEGLNGLPADDAAAAAFYTAAAEADHGRAQVLLARMRDVGRGVPQDLTEAAALYRRAAEKGIAAAQAALGSMYVEGRGVAEDLGEGYAWLAVVAARRDGGVDPRLAGASRLLKEGVAAGMTPERVREARAIAGRYMAVYAPQQPGDAKEPAVSEREPVPSGQAEAADAAAGSEPERGPEVGGVTGPGAGPGTGAVADVPAAAEGTGDGLAEAAGTGGRRFDLGGL